MNPESGHSFENEPTPNPEQKPHPREEDPYGILEKQRPVDIEVLLDILGKSAAQLKEKLEKQIIKTFNVDDPEIEAFLADMVESANMGEDAGKYFRHMTQTAQRLAVKKYEHPPRVDDTQEVMAEVREGLLRKKVSNFPGAYKKIRDSFFDSGFSEQNPESEEKDIGGGDKLQTFKQLTAQLGGVNIIGEQVENKINSTINKADAYLMLSNPENRKIVDLEALLPKGVRFVPRSMATPVEDEEVIEAGNSTASKPEPKNLKSYKGTQAEKDERFSFNTVYVKETGEVITKEVHYGNLAEPGGLLTLLHEIAHAWQSEYYDEFGKYPFKRWLKELRINAILYARSAHDKKEQAETWHQELLKMGVKLSPDASADLDRTKFILQSLPIGFDTVQYSSEYVVEGSEFTIQTETRANLPVYTEHLAELLEDFADSERQAWANAIRMVRYLRRRGVDPEPTLKTLEDFRAHIEPKLQSYDDSILHEHRVDRPKKVRKFVRPRGEKKE